ncbi:hypothetical protein HJG53_14075 [Sphingomonas sp. ID1715]|uniref:hypothetical protein n=1 Tax=Sphingomonas sp. ID1715 TaxID=1656898 RepID=UPI001487CA8C|nr:hypothetical protein [Sphingomonas sp. ID1715]NNM78030.1 hypothetical protein [Sphingomonas sp. ID1715]
MAGSADRPTAAEAAARGSIASTAIDEAARGGSVGGALRQAARASDQLTAAQDVARRALGLESSVTDAMRQLGIGKPFAERLGLTASVRDQLTQLGSLSSVADALGRAGIGVGLDDTVSKMLALSKDRTAVERALTQFGVAGLVGERLPVGLDPSMFKAPPWGERLSAFGALDKMRASEIARSARWTERIGGLSHGKLDLLVGSNAARNFKFDKISELAAGFSAAQEALRPSREFEALLGMHEGLGRTAERMALFAGSVSAVGAFSRESDASMAALLGSWRTRPDLPRSFWRDREVRREHYRRAEVDTGLVEIDSKAAVEVMVEAGVVAGERHHGIMVAMIEAGPLQVRVTAGQPRVGAYRLITAFETAMRAFVARALADAQAAAGLAEQSWFKQRVPGEIARRAQTRKDEARSAGEAAHDPLHFIDLGDLVTIITQRNNWPLFEPTLQSAEALRVDLSRLNAIRRPVMHSRPIDPVQLAEAVFIVGRITRAIKQAGGWDALWDAEG